MKYKTLWRETVKLWCFGIFKVPMIFWVRPRVLELTSQRAVIHIPLRFRAKNHLHSMYFGVLCVGADITGGIHMLYFLQKKMGNFSFVFKDFQAEFLKRAEENVNFICEDGAAIEKTIAQALQTKNRENVLVQVLAMTAKSHDLVARFSLTLSLKAKF